MALKAVHVSDVPNLDQVTENASLSLYSPRISQVSQFERTSKFVVIGHRGSGMNALQSPDQRMRAIKENTICSFNAAGKSAVDFIEFDVQVTKDDCPVIFHDNFIFHEDNDTVVEKRVTDLSLSEFLSYGPQREEEKAGKSLLRKNKDGTVVKWNVEKDEQFCTLQEAFEQVTPSLGFNVELKFDDNVVYQEHHLVHVLQSILKVVLDYAKDRPIIFSSFQPDAALAMRKLQKAYPVFFLTNGGTEIYHDKRRNSLDEAMNLCLEGGLQGIVSEVRAIFRNPGAVNKIKESKLSLLTYGKLNNVPEAVYMQHLIGVEGVIVDFVKEITEAMSNMTKPGKPTTRREEEGEVEVKAKPEFSEREISFLLKLIPELIQLQ